MISTSVTNSPLIFGEETKNQEGERIKRMNEELTIDELYKLHKMLSKSQNDDEKGDNSNRSTNNISTVIIDSIGDSAIKVIYERMKDPEKLVRKLAASILIKLC